MADNVLINLGVDFGTRFTKVCARSDGIGTTVVDFGGNGLDGMLTQSAIMLGNDGNISVPTPGAPDVSENRIAYLKMALADRGDLDVKADSKRKPKESKFQEQALSGIFIAEVVRRSKEWILDSWKDEIGGREVTWSANVGLPVEHFEKDDVRARFQEAIAVGWDWSETGIPQGKVSEILNAYENSAARKKPNESYCQAFPEIAAAIFSFATSREAAPGIYAYFDIGGGTLDGVVFNLMRIDGEEKTVFFSGHVAALGVDWVAESVCERLANSFGENYQPERVKTILFMKRNDVIDLAFNDYTDKITKFAFGIISEAKQKDRNNNWRETKVQNFPNVRTLRGIWDDGNMDPLTVFVGGGGNTSPIYIHALDNAYLANDSLKNQGVPPLSLEDVPAPPDLMMRSGDSSEYHRFLIAYGLSVPFGEGPEFKLPRQVERASRPPKRVPDVPDSLDHKDIFD